MTDTTISRMWIMRWRPTSWSALLEGKIGRDELGNTQRRIIGGEDRSGSDSAPPTIYRRRCCAAGAPQ